MEITIKHHSDDPLPQLSGVLKSVDEYYTNTTESIWELSNEQLLLAQIQLDDRYTIRNPVNNPTGIFGQYLKGLEK